ncbi:hypothetical protein HP439_17380 [Sphingobacterium shayense]|uniref:hypothetical protein n=1 Tax=Sphingobacterium shayense TaxID=626343 RepID=UPI0015570CB8|nr:hypothetical protein [Sphingobacterium shayense]NQD72503.1 hypothetical protein [Sphingobacterium shayense]
MSIQGQDSIDNPIQLDSLVNTEAFSDETEIFLNEGHYDGVPYVDSVPRVDSGYYAQIQNAYAGEEFDYDKANIQEVNFFNRFFSRIAKWLSDLVPLDSYGQFSESVYYLLSAIGIALLGWIVYRLIFTNKRLLARDKKEHGEEAEFKFVEKNLMKIDLISYIDKAKTAQDYALAIRYLNLLNIQLLVQKDIVQWKYSKTNAELIAEITDAEVKREYIRNVNIFNRIWYGAVTIDGEQYEDYARYFFNFQRKWR